MASFLHKVFDKAEEGIQRTGDTLTGIFNPDRRHDDPIEKEHDAIRTEIAESHRFQSFADERENNFVKWHIDGHDYFYALSEMLESAKECIFILDWWLTPELYLRRPPAYNEEWRLDRVLQRKAEQGVKIYVIVYKEVTQTMSMSSHHTKVALEALHPEIACMRHPDHIGSKDDVEFWSHHEKVVVVDNHRACIGGLDICFGRWDTNTHPLADAHPTDFSKTLFPGQDYNNARISDFQDVMNYVSGTISVAESPRMPWHDGGWREGGGMEGEVHMTLSGPVVLDIVQHFVERWNEVKTRKYKADARYDWLALPHNITFAPNEAVVRHPHRERWHGMGRQFRQRFHMEPEEEELEEHEPKRPWGSCRVQCVRSVSDWSHGVLTEHSIQNAYDQGGEPFRLHRSIEHDPIADDFTTTENQFFISNTKKDGPVVNQIAAALVERIVQAAQAGQKFKVVVIIPELPAFSGDVKDETALKTIMAAQYRTINRGGSSIYEEIRKAGYEPMDYIRFYHLRVYDRINAPLSTFIAKAEEDSGVKFNEAQVALARQWVGDSADTSSDGQPKEVTIKLAEPTTEGMVVSKKTDVKTEKFPLPTSKAEAVEKIERFERAAKRLRGDAHVSDTVGQHALKDRTELAEEQWLGSEEEELASYVSELSYIHTKLMIVDDRRVIMGSANLNDRSQKGDGDSEIALVVEDGDMIQSTMDGKPFMAARFAASLRRRLFRQHLGYIPPQICQDRDEHVTEFMRPAPVANPDEFGTADDEIMADPLSDEMVELWQKTAKVNREVFTELFRPVPTNLVRDWDAYNNYVPKVKTGHVAPDVPLERVKARLADVRGALVEAPIDFLIDEKDFAEGPEWHGLNPTLPIYI
ncbi:phospholipase D/nuclease [Stereum hirsutum FP-91666 SS1]|uniref:phospholipase D/nuclease n=1 Tax=Stereum hirsutum (strain FP-91666) TaxID=721885 RepID=UPI000444A126|nr:phospholipase D/nuclease [Stereum hirsutum FP-91666 SS1]EIM84706.1 phospholipase D/nuclease [Stereum hirsutum FP-91666 SS1]